VRATCGEVARQRRLFSLSIGRSSPMLWTILIVLAIIALVLFILGRVRGKRGV
jgi:hypothetical protein